jgi:hypothetical protein
MNKINKYTSQVKNQKKKKISKKFKLKHNLKIKDIKPLLK